jgi:hypothetical protein
MCEVAVDRRVVDADYRGNGPGRHPGLGESSRVTLTPVDVSEEKHFDLMAKLTEGRNLQLDPTTGFGLGLLVEPDEILHSVVGREGDAVRVLVMTASSLVYGEFPAEVSGFDAERRSIELNLWQAPLQDVTGIDIVGLETVRSANGWQVYPRYLIRLGSRPDGIKLPWGDHWGLDTEVATFIRALRDRWPARLAE